MAKAKEPNKIIKRRYEICIFEKNSGNVILYKKSNFRYWYADPFLASEGEKTYCFVELMNNHVKHGQIGVINEEGKVATIIDENKHMSFPYVFKRDGKWYMMPETSANQDLRLYVADSFPYKWSFYKTLLKDVKVCDSIFFELNGKDYLLTYVFEEKPYKVVIYDFNWATLEAGNKVCSIPDPQKVLRPAGKTICKDKKVILPTQKGTDSYGENVLFNEIVSDKIGNISLVPTEYETHYPKNITAKYDHKHTYNVCGEKAVLDFSKLVFSPFQIIDGIPCTIKKILKRK